MPEIAIIISSPAGSKHGARAREEISKDRRDINGEERGQLRPEIKH